MESTIKNPNAISGEVCLLVDDRFQSFSSLFIGSNGNPYITYGVDNAAIPVEAAVTLDPAQIYVNVVANLKFSNGLIIECSPEMPFYVPGAGDIQAQDLKAGTKVLGARYTQENGITGCDIYVVSSSTEFKAVSTPLYGFTPLNGNILLPKMMEEDNSITFVCVR